MLKGAIIGFGGVAANGHLPAYAECPDLEICAVVDSVPERRADAESRGLRAYASITDLARSEALNFVDICTPPAFHAAPIFAALEAGWHVLCEKPLLLDPAEYKKAVELSRKQRRVIVPVHNWKYAPILRTASAFASKGLLGAIRTAEVRTYRVGHCKGKVGDSTDWRVDPAIAGGGILIDHGWHAFYLVLDWIGKDPKRIAAKIKRANEESLDHEVDVAIAFEGAEGLIHLTWDSQSRRNTARIVGDRGEIAIDDKVMSIRSKDFTGALDFESALSAGSHHADWFTAMLPDFFVKTIAGERPAEAALREAGWCMELTRAAYAAEREKRDAVDVALEF